MGQDDHFTFSHYKEISNIGKKEIKNIAQRSCGIRHSSHVCRTTCERFNYRLLGRIYTHRLYSASSWLWELQSWFLLFWYPLKTRSSFLPKGKPNSRNNQQFLIYSGQGNVIWCSSKWNNASHYILSQLTHLYHHLIMVSCNSFHFSLKKISDLVKMHFYTQSWIEADKPHPLEMG